MGIFQRNPAPESLHNRLKALEERCDSLERQGKSLRLEWEELYDKVRHQMSRISRRVASANSSEVEPPIGEAAAEPLPGVDPISRSIMLRRGMQGLKK